MRLITSAHQHARLRVPGPTPHAVLISRRHRPHRCLKVRSVADTRKSEAERFIEDLSGSIGTTASPPIEGSEVFDDTQDLRERVDAGKAQVSPAVEYVALPWVLSAVALAT
jgi:hypothetical protein